MDECKPLTFGGRFGFGGDKYKFESDEKDVDRDIHTDDGRRIVERERAALEGGGARRIGTACPYYFELGDREMGSEAEQGELAGGGAEQHAGAGQGLALVHLSAQLELCLTQENTLHILDTP